MIRLRIVLVRRIFRHPPLRPLSHCPDAIAGRESCNAGSRICVSLGLGLGFRAPATAAPDAAVPALPESGMPAAGCTPGAIRIFKLERRGRAPLRKPRPVVVAFDAPKRDLVKQRALWLSYLER